MTRQETIEAMARTFCDQTYGFHFDVWGFLAPEQRKPWIDTATAAFDAIQPHIQAEREAVREVCAECRFWDNFITLTTSIFNEEEVRQYVAHPYTNEKHLREIEAHAASLLGLRTLPGGKRSLNVPDMPETRQVLRAKKRRAVLKNPPRAPENVLKMNQTS